MCLGLGTYLCILTPHFTSLGFFFSPKLAPWFYDRGVFFFKRQPALIGDIYMQNQLSYQLKLNEALKSKLALADLLMKLNSFMKEVDEADRKLEQDGHAPVLAAVHNLRKGLEDEALAALKGLKFFNELVDEPLLEFLFDKD